MAENIYKENSYYDFEAELRTISKIVSNATLPHEVATKNMDNKNILQEFVTHKTEDLSSEKYRKTDENFASSLMNIFVGFLRLTNFLSATTVLFILISNIMDKDFWNGNLFQNSLTCIQSGYLGSFAMLTYIDTIATISFCWREYGELSRDDCYEFTSKNPQKIHLAHFKNNIFNFDKTSEHKNFHCIE